MHWQSKICRGTCCHLVSPFWFTPETQRRSPNTWSWLQYWQIIQTESNQSHTRHLHKGYTATTSK